MRETVRLFIERARAVAAEVHEVPDDAAAEARAEGLKREKETAGVSADVAYAALGIAETGTCAVVTDDEKTRLATMLPEASILVLHASDIVPDLPDAAPFLRTRQADGKVSYTSFISGPSRTADIERVSAIGVHGPLELHVILVTEGAA